MVGAVFAAMFILLILAVPICVVISMISLIPYGIDATFAASPTFIFAEYGIRPGLHHADSNPHVCPLRHHHGPWRDFQKAV